MRRQAARVVLLDPDNRVLLLAAQDPFNPAKGQWWELPGGGMEHGEDSAAAAARELFEETGISEVEMGPCTWRHDARFTFAGLRFDQLEHIHIARCAGFDSAYVPPGLEALEAMAFVGYRWWVLEDLVEHQRGGGRLIPPWLCDQLSTFLAGGPPPELIYLGELGNVV